MVAMMKKWIWMALAVIVVAGGTWFARMMLPGGALQGTLAPVPLTWDGTTIVDVVALETHRAEPYSVKIWIVPMGDRLYVHAGDNHNRWVQYIEQDPAVRVGNGDTLYELNAERVTAAEEFAGFADAYEVRYGTRPRNENVAEVYLFRLVAR